MARTTRITSAEDGIKVQSERLAREQKEALTEAADGTTFWTEKDADEWAKAKYDALLGVTT